MEINNTDPFEKELKKLFSVQIEEADILSKELLHLDNNARNRVLKTMTNRLNGHPLMGYVLKLLLESATANENYEVCATVKEFANENKIQIEDIYSIMKRMMAENPGKNLLIRMADEQ